MHSISVRFYAIDGLYMKNYSIGSPCSPSLPSRHIFACLSQKVEDIRTICTHTLYIIIRLLKKKNYLAEQLPFYMPNTRLYLEWDYFPTYTIFCTVRYKEDGRTDRFNFSRMDYVLVDFPMGIEIIIQRLKRTSRP